jgi:hypothetical protein
MRRLFLLGALLLLGCRNNVVGPFAPRQPERVDDPRLPIAEQERRGRDRLAYPVASPAVGPPTYADTQGIDRPGGSR